jgi:hypothetical protein
MITFNQNDYEQLNDNLIEVYFNIITQFTMNCFHAERLQDKSENTKKYFESYEKVLMSWSRIKDIRNGLVFKKYAKTIINAFIQSRLSDADDLGVLLDNSNGPKLVHMSLKNSSSQFDSESINDDIAEDDYQYYKDVLVTLSEFALCIPDYCLPLLSK